MLNKITDVHLIWIVSKARMYDFPLGAFSTLIHAAVSEGKLCLFGSNSFTYSSTNRKVGPPPLPTSPNFAES